MPYDARIRRRLKLRDLDTLLTVARCRSMAKAATELAVSQPAGSKTIADMEHTLGVRLLDRTAQGVRPTLYGEALMKWANVVFDDVRQGLKEIEFLADPSAGELRIGAAEPMLGGFLAAVIAQINRRYPHIVFEVTHGPSVAQLLRDLRDRRFDFVIGRVMHGQNDDDLTAEILFEEPWSVVAGPQNRFVRRRKVALSDLLNEPWSMPPPDSVVGVYLTQIFRDAGLERPRAVVTCGSMQMHEALMASGSFLAIFPRSLLKFSAGRITAKVLPVKLPGRPPPVGIVTLKNRTLSPVTQLFVECARELAVP